MKLCQVEANLRFLRAMDGGQAQTPQSSPPHQKFLPHNRVRYRMIRYRT